MAYPGHVVKIGEPDAAIVTELAAGLAKRGYVSASPAGVFDAAFRSLVRLFQSQNVDPLGRPLVADGLVGPMTWGAVFDTDDVAPASAVASPGSAAAKALAIAIGEVGVMESPLGSNRGARVDIYQRKTGLAVPPGNFWCMAFVYWCFLEANGDDNPFPRTAGCLDAWNKVKAAAPGRILTRAKAIANPALVRPGMVFILDHGGNMGHAGFVREAQGGGLKTVEGNSNTNGSSNGLGVFNVNHRNIMDPQLKGFIDFT